MAEALASSEQVIRLAGALGAEIRGLDLGAAGEEAAGWVRRQLLDHLVLFFPDQSMSVDQHIAFGRRFGRLESHPNLKNPFTQRDDLFELAASQGGVADEWHTDLTFQEQPAVLSILRMVKCPQTGGDTIWTNLYAAFEGLSAPMQDLCSGLTALHDAASQNQPEQMAVHPVVREHPETGRKALYVNELFTTRIVELSAGESEVLLRHLTNWVKNPRFTVRYRWAENTVAIWDNRCTQHFVLNDFEEERIIQRVTVVGDQPKGAAPRWAPWPASARRSAATHRDRQLHSFLKRRGGEAERQDGAN